MSEVVVYVFDGKRSAQHELDKAIEKFPYAGYYWLEDIAVISRSKSGRTRVHSTWAQDSDNVGESGAFGALTGSLVGALFGLAGALAGLVSGGAIGSVTGKAINVDISDPRLEELKDNLKKNTSALVLVGTGAVEAFVDTFASTKAQLIRSAITAQELEELSSIN